MPYAQVTPVVDVGIRALCVKPYPLHPTGCPNFNLKPGCPPHSPRLSDYFDLAQPTYAIWNVFALGVHARAMRTAHPGWSERQVYCCLYWQPRARKALEGEIDRFMGGPRLVAARWVTRCPEAMGLDVTATMKSIGVVLEWPPREFAVQVALAGVRKSADDTTDEVTA